MRYSLHVALYAALLARAVGRPLGYGDALNSNTNGAEYSTQMLFPVTSMSAFEEARQGDDVDGVAEPVRVTIIAHKEQTPTAKSVWSSWQRRKSTSTSSEDEGTATPSKFERLNGHSKHHLFGDAVLSPLFITRINAEAAHATKEASKLTKRSLANTTALSTTAGDPALPDVAPAEAAAMAALQPLDTTEQTSIQPAEDVAANAAVAAADDDDDDDDSNNDTGERARLAHEDQLKKSKNNAMQTCLQHEKSGTMSVGTCETQELTQTLAGVLRRRAALEKETTTTAGKLSSSGAVLEQEAMTAGKLNSSVQAAIDAIQRVGDTVSVNATVPYVGDDDTANVQPNEERILASIKEIEALKAARAKLEEAIVKIEEQITKSGFGNAYLTATIPL